MGDYTVPDEIRAFKPVGTIVKKIKNNYYVYSHSQIKDPKTSKWKTEPGKLLGKIIPGVGFCPNNLKSSLVDDITCFDYGEYLLISNIARDEYNNLLQVFNKDEALTIFIIASIYASNGFIGLKALIYEYEKSLFKRDYKSLPFSYHIISKLIETIGRSDKQSEYQKLIYSNASDFISIDGHIIPSFSLDNDLSSFGYKSRELKSEYMNLMVALDVKTYMPLATKVFPGYMLDKMDFIDFLNTFDSLDSKIILVDMGFYSNENIDYIKERNGFYIIPVSENRIEYKTIIKPRKGRLKEFLYHRNKKVDTVETKEETVNGKRIIYFNNISERERLTQLYLLALENNKKGFSTIEYEKQKDSFGVIVLETNLDKTPNEIYELYKSRWSIETYFDRLKNGINFEALNLDDYGMTQGLSFILMITSRIDARIFEASKRVSLSRKELIKLMKYIKLTDNNKTVNIHNIKKEHREVLDKLNIVIDTTKKCLG